MHVHLIGRALEDKGASEQATRDDPGTAAIIGAEHARRTLLAGFTSVRQVGAGGFEDIGLAKPSKTATCRVQAMVDEATKIGVKVAAHAHGAEGITVATRAGVASIGHGSFLDEEGATLMAANGTFLVPTPMAGEALLRAADAGQMPPYIAIKARAVFVKKNGVV